MIGLVLGAGGVVGHAWHAGVLDALHEHGWDARDADVVVGTSAGSVIAALLRAGIGAPDLFARATGGKLSADARRALQEAGIAAPAALPPRSRRTASAMLPASPVMAARLVLAPWRLRPGLVVAGLLPRGRIDASAIGTGIRALHRDGWPERPLWICAVRLDRGRRVVFGRDADVTTDVGTAVAASCAIPGWFSPVSVGGHDYVDGGAHSPTNADVVAGLDLDLVVVSSPMSLDRQALRRPAIDRMLRIQHRAALQREVTVVRDERTEVVTFQPGPDDVPLMGGTADSMDAGRRVAVARRARDTTLRRLESPRLQAALSALPRPMPPAP